jgi:hypothetical protein
MTQVDSPPYSLEFHREGDGTEVVKDWLLGLSPVKRRAVGVALHEVLRPLGPDVCDTRYGRNLGRGLIEFRLAERGPGFLAALGRPARRATEQEDEERLELSVFCHCDGDRIILLSGYDKGSEHSRQRQQGEVARARAHLADWRAEQRRLPRAAQGSRPPG